ncbi:S1 RNA-binding domain-containing protein [Acholeplasma sp. OttesenSCG-928-E16]|nr:S1 RNA-binding domain-containing protein [Acholeplasma sp. OttesenSCG-928-E16]
MKIGDIIVCKVTAIKQFGVFIKYQEYTGLIHISEISDLYVEDITECIEVNENIHAIILNIDENSKRLELSYKKAHFDDLEIAKKYKIKKGFKPLRQRLNKWVEKKEK